MGLGDEASRYQCRRRFHGGSVKGVEAEREQGRNAREERTERHTDTILFLYCDALGLLKYTKCPYSGVGMEKKGRFRDVVAWLGVVLIIIF